MEKRFSDWISRINRYLFRRLNRKYKTITTVLYTYDNILLSTYTEIAQTGNTDLLVISGTPSDKEIEAQWEKIVSQNASVTGGHTDQQLDNIKDYARLLSTYVQVKASLLQLCLCVDDDCIAFLEYKGYRINKSSQTAYNDSITNGLQKVKNVITKLQSRHKIIMDASKGHDESIPLKSSIETMLANVSAHMGFNIDPSITLARFNEYNRIIRARQAQQTKTKVA